jgi:tetratricopeptide (TPR) repeat protein
MKMVADKDQSAEENTHVDADEYDEYYDDDEYYDEDEEAPRDPWVRWLAIVSGVLVILVLVVVAYGVYRVNMRLQGPRTAVERDLRAAMANAAASPNNYDTLFALAEMQVIAQKYGDAEATLAKMKKIEPDRAGTPYLQGLMAASQKDFDRALKYYATALEMGNKVPSSVLKNALRKGLILPRDYHQDVANDAAFEAGRLQLYMKKNPAAAKKLLLEAVAIDPQDAGAYVLLGDIAAKAGDKKGAIANYREALKYVPDYPQAIAGLKKLGAKP